MIEEERLISIVGAGNVIRDQSILKEYSKDISFVNTLRPDYVIKPSKFDDIQEVVKLANETLTPLVPVSSGPPHFRGDTIPGIGGSIVVDLSGMKKIMRVDRFHRVAMIEAGVTFEELIPAAEKEKLRLNMPLLPRKSKSVLGSMLEREPVIMPKYQWDISDPLACLGIIFGTGDDFRTGQAAGPGTIEQQWSVGGAQKAPYGPGASSWHRLIQGAQGTMGIVTWASLRCEILPSLEEPFLVGSAHLDRLFELTHWLVRLRLANECFILNSTAAAAIMANKWPEDYRDLKNSLPTWVVFFNLAGYDYYPEDRVSYQKKDMLDLTQRLGLEALKSIGGVSAVNLLKLIQKPSEDPYWKLRFKGASQDIFFLSTYQRIPDLLETMYDEVNTNGYPVSDLSIYIQPGVQGTSCHCEFNLFYDPEIPAERNRIKELTASAVKSLLAKGAFFSRPYDASARLIINRDAATISALTKVKNILDPNNIMNPGKLCF
jgi:hypothetical protein